MGRSSRHRRIYRLCRLHINGRAAATPLSDAPRESLEATTTSESAWALLDSEKLRAIGRVSSRLFGKFVSETWSDYFDAVVVIRQEVAPTFDPWK